MVQPRPQHPLPRLFVPGRLPHGRHQLRPRTNLPQLEPVELQTTPDDVGVAVRDPWDHPPALSVDYPGAWTDVRAHCGLVTECRDSVTRNRQGGRLLPRARRGGRALTTKVPGVAATPHGGRPGPDPGVQDDEVQPIPNLAAPVRPSPPVDVLAQPVVRPTPSSNPTVSAATRHKLLSTHTPAGFGTNDKHDLTPVTWTFGIRQVV